MTFLCKTCTSKKILHKGRIINGAEDEIRTRDLNLGKVALYQLSYFRIFLRASKGVAKISAVIIATKKF